MHYWSWAFLSPCFAGCASVAVLEATEVVAYGRRGVITFIV